MILPQDASNDQSNCPNGYYRNTSGMVMQLPNVPQSPANAPMSDEQLQRLEDMSRIELMGLIERMARQCGMVAAMSEAETAQAMLDTLAHTALMPISPSINMKADIQCRLSAIDKWLDRKQGKPVQAINQTSTIAMLVQNLQPDVELLKRIKNDLINGMVIDN